jgi:hypothetical protein
MLQIALLLLSCGLSRYVWSVNISVARVVISFTVLGVIFYLGIVIVGTSSYECPFQTPASTTLRALRSKRTTQRLLESLSPPRVISFVYITWRDVRRWFTSRYCRIRHAAVHPRPWGISVSTISGITTNIEHQTIILLLHVDRALGNAKQRLVQGVRRCTRAMLLPIAHDDPNYQSCVPQAQGGLLIPVRNIRSLREWNADNARCVCWIIRNITDPEALDSAIRFAGTIHWFDGDVDVDPPFEFIVSTFEACFDSAKKSYPGMSDRAYFSGRAILRISKAAELRSPELASKYPIPIPPGNNRYDTEGVNMDLFNVLCWFSREISYHELGPPSLGSTQTYSMWMSNLLVDSARTGFDSFIHITLSRTKDITPLGHAIDANTILSRFISLSGPVEEETFWADDKSYAVVHHSYFQPD